MNQISQFVESAKQEIAAVTSRQALVELKSKLLGRNSELRKELAGFSKLTPTEKKKRGEILNHALKTLETLFVDKEKELLHMTKSEIDATLPGLKPTLGAIHPITRVTNDLIEIFSRIGFEVAEGPEVETEANNFDLLNIPADHPARDEWDTFWIKSAGSSPSPRLRRAFDGWRVAGSQDDRELPATSHLLLRTHTSPVQIRYMKRAVAANIKPPIRIIAPGRTFRYEAEDATHSAEFYQLEGLMVDRGVSVADLKGVIEYFLKEMFGATRFRLRPSFFPFTEPSFEVDMFTPSETGRRRRPRSLAGFVPGKDKSFLELLGCGMVHPKVLQNCGIASGYTGFAFGVGIDRIAMIKYGISDIRQLLGGDMKFIKQFR